MRIISGTAGGIPIQVPAVVTRPTMDKVRQAIFSSIAEFVPDARVLDLFAGSGAYGLECLSRGARSALFVEQHRPACAVIQANVAKTRLAGAEVRCADALRVVRDMAAAQGSPFDLIFADPPYVHGVQDRDWAQELLAEPALLQVVAAGGSFLLECRVSKLLPPPTWRVVRDRAYGTTRLLWLTPASTDGIAAI
jgi:16S rRNA (guanine966-N2)-methyltransferase